MVFILSLYQSKALEGELIMDNLDRMLMNLEEGETRYLLRTIIRNAEIAAGDVQTPSPLAEQIMELWDQHQSRKKQEEAQRNHIHILFTQSDAGAMKVALSGAGYQQVSKVLSFMEFFSIGPLRKLHRKEGYLFREEWFRERFQQLHYFFHLNKEHTIQNMVQTINQLPEDKKITLWCADNANDQTGLRFALHLLSKREQPIQIVNVTQAYKEIAEQYDPAFQPWAVGHIPNEALQHIIKLTEETPPLTSTQRQQYEQEWQTLNSSEEMLRVWLYGQVKSVPESYYDEAILSITASLQNSAEVEEDGYVKAGLIVGSAIEQWKQYIGDSFIEYRIWTLISEGRLLFKGIPHAMYLYKLKVPF